MRYVRYETKKIAKMLDELSTFFLERGASELNIYYKGDEHQKIITVEAKGVGDQDEAILDLKNFLSHPRELEIEEYYWELAGDANKSEEMGILGAMTDEASISYDEEQICVELIRNR